MTSGGNERRRTILIVDDDLDFLEQMGAVLEAAGFAVAAARSEREAVEALDRGLPDLAIVDLMMESADSGLVLCYRIKKRDPARPVILVTAVAAEAVLDFGAAAAAERAWVKADASLVKPVRAEQLVREVRRLLKE